MKYMQIYMQAENISNEQISKVDSFLVEEFNTEEIVIAVGEEKDE